MTGREEGRKEGEIRGLAKGREEGEMRGLAKGREETARKMKSMGLAVEIIAEATGLTVEEISAFIGLQSYNAIRIIT